MIKAIIMSVSFVSMFAFLYGYNNKNIIMRKMKCKKNRIPISKEKFPIVYGVRKK